MKKFADINLEMDSYATPTGMMDRNINTATKMRPTPEMGKSRGGDIAIENNSSNPPNFPIRKTVTIDTNPIMQSVLVAPGVA